VANNTFDAVVVGGGPAGCAAAAGGFALAAGDLPFTIIFAAMSWVALGLVFRQRDK